jgi:hypothetical protein
MHMYDISMNRSPSSKTLGLSVVPPGGRSLLGDLFTYIFIYLVIYLQLSKLASSVVLTCGLTEIKYTRIHIQT